MKTKEELHAIKTEVENLNIKLAELTDDELTQVTGGMMPLILLKGKARLIVDPHDGQAFRFYPHDEHLIGFDPRDEQVLGFVPGIKEIS